MTIVFSDLKGSTSLGEALDSEALREVMTRYFDAMRGELERHGGVIEKFIGDAVMAVFGLPRLHEDDALRAVRAAAGMQAALETLNVELERHYGVQLTNRTGVNTGEVVAGDPSTGQRLVTGDAVNVAARLEQAAGEREVLLGELTYRLVRDSVEVAGGRAARAQGEGRAGSRVPARPREGEPATSSSDAALRWSAARRELAALEAIFDEAVTTRVGAPRHARRGRRRRQVEAHRRVPRADPERRVPPRGRCLPYGDGITFWPLAEALKTRRGDRQRRRRRRRRSGSWPRSRTRPETASPSVSPR